MQTNSGAELARLFAQVSASFRIEIDRRFAALDVNAAQVAVLGLLWNEDGRTQAEIARGLGVSAPTVNKMLRTMESRGLVRQERCASDSRSMRIYLTEAGFRVRGAVDEAWRDIGRERFSGLTSTEVLILSQLLEKIG